MSEMIKDLKKVLFEVIRDSSKIFIIGHNEPDFDSIGSSIGLLTICRLLGRKAYIIVDDSDISLEPGVKKIIDENRKNLNIIDMNAFKKLVSKNSSLIITDTNKDYLIAVKDYLANFKYKVIIDHHAEDEHTVDADYKFITPQVSSASEMVAQVLNSYRYRYDGTVANSLLAGIELDTNHYQNNTTDRTHDVAENLIKRGANPREVTQLFRTEFETDRRINNLIFDGSLFEKYERDIFQTRQVSFTLNRNAPSTVYKKEDLAKVADRMLDYGMDATFAIGYVKEGLVSISARSKSDIDVGSIMSKLGGGGNSASAACKIDVPDDSLGGTPSIIEVEEKLRRIVSETITGPNTNEITDITIAPTITEENTIETAMVKVKV